MNKEGIDVFVASCFLFCCILYYFFFFIYLKKQSMRYRSDPFNGDGTKVANGRKQGELSVLTTPGPLLPLQVPYEVIVI